MDKLTNVLNNALVEIASAGALRDLELLKVKYTGKSGIITSLMQELKTLPPEQKRDFGAGINRIKNSFETSVEERKKELDNIELSRKLTSETIDVTLDGRGLPIGSLHPISLSLKRMTDIFASLGFQVADGPEIETDYYNFQALNIPANHPARAMQDTFYTEGGEVLRTHTSPIQVRFAEKHTPPIKIIAPGRTYRVDMDRTHSPMFHQLEGLWIDKDISFANLKGVLIKFLRLFFAKDDLQVRFRASFFPFTEPSAEIDICDDKGRWLEVAGCGMVHPKVLKYMKIDSAQYSGFAFGIGIDRFSMLRYGINDLRLMFENDLDFLQQFKGKE